MRFFGRIITVQIGDLFIEARASKDFPNRQVIFRIQFEVIKDDAKEPNSLSLKIYNLSDNSRRTPRDGSPIILSVGYEEASYRIFSGQIKKGGTVNTRERVDWVTSITATDGGKFYSSKRINESLGPGASITEAIKAAAKSLGLGLGNLESEITPSTIRRNIGKFRHGIVMSGRSSDVLDSLITTAGFEWSIQDGAIQVVKPKKPINTKAVLLNARTGLIGTPEVGEQGIINGRSLLQGDIWPGRQIQIESQQFDGGAFVVNKVTHQGDTHGDDWYTDFEASPLK